jgi:hypothetical protein
MVKGSRWVLVIVLGVLSQGCSFMFVDGPPDRHEKMLYFDCTSTAGPEVVDISNAAVLGLVAAGSAEDNSGGAAVNLAAAGVFGASAIYGIVKTTECNAAKDALRIRLMKIFERDARLRAQEMERVRRNDAPDLLTHPKRLPKRKKRPVVPPPAPEQALPPGPPPSGGEPPPAPPSPAAPGPSPVPTPPGGALLPGPAAPTAPPPAPPPPAAPAAPKAPAPVTPAPTAPKAPAPQPAAPDAPPAPPPAPDR